ncbi:serine/arginine repetitive matrix protein 2-like isoform X1 [Daphnia pulicaria]|uniref:serine/arginine repetitive matrix protein 2-like isoform X1 n=1 Tax=Daphnia pulicaria TaxID=35523 RepID=UPI001EEA37A9|nr:serine/arginine repetitive matrix protein 2-like isoform X1 [Daphnia pulicaria]XP_046652918.1 serine/arginine repetitive matrix protein 2-like isoform X1 [Daphnia pulicaria]
MDPELVVQTLNFHGQQLTKLWENERGAASLQVASLRDLDYQVYQKRSKDLGFQERGKRIRMHQFIVDKAPQLFKAEKKPKESVNSALQAQDEDFFPLMPPLESFCHFDKSESRTNFFETIKIGDVLIGQVQQKNFHGLVFRVVATEDSTILRDVRELAIKGSIQPDQYTSDRKEGAFNTGDLIRCEVIDFNADNEKLVCGMKGLHQPAERADLQFGIVTKEQLPKSYKAMVDLTGKSYEECLQSNRTFRNPSAIEHLSKSLGLNLSSDVPDSFLKGLNAPIEASDYADELRKSQNSKWATKSVAEGIKYFKAGLETEAFQCLNKALHIDPVNIEGLVARGALYANRGSYDKAITDFEAALKERPNHANATNYLSETLVAYAKQYEDEKNVDTALQLYQKCLGVNPSHPEARASLQRLSKSRQRPNFNIDFMDMENGSSARATGKGTEETEQKDEGRKSRRHRKRGKRGSSSSSKSGSSSSSRFSSTGSDSSRGRSRSKKSRRSKKAAKHEPSLSPFSKKMAQLNPSNAATLAGDVGQVVPPNQPTFYPSTEYPSISTQPHPVPPPAFGALGGNPPPPAFAGYASSSGASGAQGQTVGYEKEVQNFIQRTALNEEYEKKVELFLQRVGKGGKDGEKKEEKEKDKKKKKKKDRSKDKKKKDGKRDKNKEKKHKKKKKGSDDEDSDKQISPNLSGLDELGELEAKLSAVYNKLTAKESSKKKKKRKRHSSNSSDSSSSSGSSSDSELERKKRKAKKALEDLAAAAGLLRGGESKLNVKPEPVPPPSYVPTPGAAGMSASAGGASGDDDDYPGKWRPMALKVKLGRGSDEPEVEESRMVYMKEEKRAPPAQQALVEQEEEMPPGDFREDKVSFKIQSFGLFGPGPRQAPPKPVSPPKTNEQAQSEANQDKERGSRSRSRSQRRRSRSRSQSRSRSRGRSYSRSGSRSRSRSGSRDRRRRSRSHSGDRRHQNQRYRGGNRHPNQNYHHRGGRYPQRGGFQNRGRGWNNNYNNNRGGYNNRPYNNRPYHNNNNNNQGGYDNRRHRGRNRGGYWQQQMQRSYSRSRSRSRTRSRSRSRSRSYSRSVSRSPSRSRSRSRQDNYRGRDRDARDNRDARDTSPQGRNDQDQHRNDRESGERDVQQRSPAREEKPGPVPAPAAAVTASSSQSDRRKVGSKWDDGGGDDDEDLVPPGCE